MKKQVLGFIAACGIGAMLSAPAYCEGMEFIYNDTVINADAKIINDRTMVSIDTFEALGITVRNNDGKWSFSKDEDVLLYDESTQIMTAGDLQVPVDVKPVITPDEKILPLRATVENLGIIVGWDRVEEKVVLIDVKTYFETIKEKYPELYKLVTLKEIQPEKGEGSGILKFKLDILEEQVLVNLDLSSSNAVKDEMTSGSLALNNLKVDVNGEGVELSDVNFDGIYDSASMTVYIKTNVLDKIMEILPEEDKAELAGISALITSESWYKLDLVELFKYIYGYVGDMDDVELEYNISKLLKSGMNTGRFMNYYLNNNLYADDVEAFNDVKKLIEIYAAAIDSGLICLKEEGTTVVITVDVNKDKIADILIKTAAIVLGEEPTEEEILEAMEELEDFKLDGKAEIIIEDGITKKIDVASDGDINGVVYELEFSSDFDAEKTSENIEVPAAAIDILQIIEMFAQTEEMPADTI